MTSRGLRQGAWTVQELGRLRQLLPWRGVEGAAALLRRTPESVRRRAAQLLAAPPRRGEWTKVDDEALRIAWGGLEPRLIATMLGRPVAEVTKRAATIRASRAVGPWTHEEDLLLKRVHGTRSVRDLEVCLRRSAKDIEQRAAHLCLHKDKRWSASASGGGDVTRSPRWTAREVEQLRSLYADRDNLEIARAMGRSVVSVANKAWQLGLHKGRKARAQIGRANVAFRFREQG